MVLWIGRGREAQHVGRAGLAAKALVELGHGLVRGQQHGDTLRHFAIARLDLIERRLARAIGDLGSPGQARGPGIILDLDLDHFRRATASPHERI